MHEFPRVAPDVITGCVIPHVWVITYFALELWHRRLCYLTVVASFRRVVLGLLCMLTCPLHTLIEVIYMTPSYNMGNESSSIPSDCTSPTSEWQSVHSFGSKRRSSESTRLPTPTDPPEPDLTHLSEEEIKQIRSVIGRAKDLQQEEQQRIR